MSFSDSFNSLLALSSSSLADLHLNPLYVLPVTAVLILCLLVYAFGFKSTSPVPPSLNSLILKDAKKNSSKKGNRSNEKNGSRAAGKSQNGPVTVASAGAAVRAKPKAVVHPVRQEPRVKRQKELPAPAHKSVADEDEDTGDWVPVLSDKTKKKALKQKQDAGKVVPAAVETVAAEHPGGDGKNEEHEAAETVVAEPVRERLQVENWEVDDPIEEKEYKAAENRAKKKTGRRGKDPRPEFSPQTSLTAASPPDAEVAKVVKDKITSEILATYDSVPDTEKTAAAAKKKKEKRKTKAEPVSQNSLQPEKLPVAGNKATANAEDGRPNPEPGKGQSVTGPVRVAVPKPAANPASQSSEATDVTDVTDGELLILTVLRSMC